MFLDYVKIYVKAGRGGDGAVAFRREKYVPKGGPSGGNGGKGGDIIFVADRNENTLINFRYKRKFVADNGSPGGSSLKDGKSGSDVIIKVPVGTLIRDTDTQEDLYDMDEDQKKVVFLSGGRGGKGNSNFATSTNQTPRFAENGREGEERNLVLELKLIADIGLVGFPNAGKSTFISSVSAAKPKIADYPFTTLEPVLGIVNYKDHQSFVIADIPGIIEGAHKGRGLGHKFLRHIERTNVLLLVIDSTSEDIQKQYNILNAELKNFSPELFNKKKIVALTKIDLLDEQMLKKLKKKKIRGYSDKILIFSAVSRTGINDTLDYLWEMLSV